MILDIQKFKCVECNEIPESTVMESSCCNSIYCFKCCTKSRSACSGCSKPWEVNKCAPNLLAQKLISQLLVTCPHDGCGKSFNPNELLAHKIECKFAVYQCNSCNSVVSKLLPHLCPDEEINCGFGCQDKIKRKDQDNHNEENTHKHLNFMKLKVEQQQKQIEELKQQSQMQCNLIPFIQNLDTLEKRNLIKEKSKIFKEKAKNFLKSLSIGNVLFILVVMFHALFIPSLIKVIVTGIAAHRVFKRPNNSRIASLLIAGILASFVYIRVFHMVSFILFRF